MMKKTIALALWLTVSLYCWVCCVADGDADLSETAVPAPVSVTLNVSPAPLAGEADVRATTPMDPDVENLIYDLWVIQFTDEGSYALFASAQHLRTDVTTGNASASETVSLLPLPGYVCVVANRNAGDATQDYGALFDEGDDASNYQTLEEFSKALVTVDVAALNLGAGVAGKMLMCGYWQGTPSAQQSLNITLSRMMTRLNITVTNSTGSGLNATNTKLTFTLQNAPQRTYLFPSVNAEALDATKAANYTTLSDAGISLSYGSSAKRYYYICPNYCTSETGATKLVISNKTKSRDVVLGTDAPGTSNRDLNLYHNTIYTFTITMN